MVKYVVELNTHLKFRSFADSRILVELEIKVVESRAAQDVPSGIPEGSRHFLRKRGLTEPNMLRRSARIRIRDRTYEIWTVGTREVLEVWLRTQI